MKYWIITTEFPPFHGGGISTFNLHNAIMLQEKGHEVTVFVNAHDINSDIERSTFRNINVIRFKPGNQAYYNYLGYHAALSYQFSELILQEITAAGNPDFIETQDYHGIGYYLMLRKKLCEKLLLNIPIVLTAHTPSFFYLRYNQYPLYQLPDFWTGEMEKWTLKAADIRLSPSHFLIDNIKPELEEAYSQYTVLRYPFKQLYNTPPHSYDVTEGDIVFFGKLTYQKGPLHLLNFFSELWDEGFEYNLSFIGSDHYFDPKQMGMKDYLIKKFKRYYDDKKFTFEGKLTPEALTKRLEKTHLTIVPSLVDNYPFAVIEAMTQGKVLLISDGGGQREMIEDGISGFIYDHKDVNSFKEKINKALKCTKEEYKQISLNAHSRISSITDYDKIYREKLAILQAYKNTNQTAGSYFPMVRNIPKGKPTQVVPSTNGRLSIVIPYYNVGKYIRETLENIYQISYDDFEVIVVNDGSDEAESIDTIISLQNKYPFKLIHQKNQGLSGARNTGLKNTTGEFIAFIDADDKIHADFYKRAVDILHQYTNLSFVSSWAQFFEGSDDIWAAQNPEPPFLLLHNMVNCGFVCRREDYYNFGMNDTRFEYGLEDYDANISLLKNGCRGVVIPEPLYYYRVHAQSMARGFNKTNQLYLYSLLANKHADFYKQYSGEVFNLLLANGPSYLYDNPTQKPGTDVMELKTRIVELEKAINWYDYSLKHYQANGNPNTDMPPVSLDISGTEYITIRDYYHKEYEVLPLWFKRLGHIIKVFQGHRTFKSLFYDK
jgi:glycogen(starch) synthase